MSCLETFSTGAARASGLVCLVLGWRPADFWAATPEELASILAAFAPGAGDQPVTASALIKLQEHFPDG